MSIDTLKKAKEIRKTALEIVSRAKASHIGSALSITDILTILYLKILTIYPLDPNNENRDRFILSKGHACTALYATLAVLGFYKKEELETYGQDFSIFMNHVSHYVPGVEFSMGALGHGLPMACGVALSAKISKKEWKTYVLLSDGELQEGSNWEALMFAAHHKISNLIVCIDYNNLQSLKTVSETIEIEPLTDKLKSFGLNVEECEGHDHKEIEQTFRKCSLYSNAPTAIIFKTIKGKGVTFMENKIEWHYKSPTKEELILSKEEIENS